MSSFEVYVKVALHGECRGAELAFELLLRRAVDVLCVRIQALAVVKCLFADAASGFPHLIVHLFDVPLQISVDRERLATL